MQVPRIAIIKRGDNGNNVDKNNDAQNGGADGGASAALEVPNGCAQPSPSATVCPTAVTTVDR